MRAGPHDILRAMSVCALLSAGLATALAGPDAGPALATLERDIPLVVSSGGGRLWYREHPLPPSHLRAELQRQRPDLVAGLPIRAASWLMHRGLPLPAPQYARQSGEQEHVWLLLHQAGVEPLATGDYAHAPSARPGTARRRRRRAGCLPSPRAGGIARTDRIRTTPAPLEVPGRWLCSGRRGCFSPRDVVARGPGRCAPISAASGACSGGGLPAEHEGGEACPPHRRRPRWGGGEMPR